jgi:hypothetical protein
MEQRKRIYLYKVNYHRGVMNRFDIALGKEPKELPKERALTEDETAVVKELYQNKSAYKNTHAYVTVARKLVLKKWNGRHPSDDKSNWSEAIMQPGATLKIVMVSRFGDCGLTDDLSAINGYHIRVEFDDPSITNIRRNP